MNERREHEIAEWQWIELEGLILSERDRRLAEQLSRAQKVHVEEMRDGLRITANSWVGVIGFSSFELRIVPKLAGDQLGLVELLDLVTGIGGLQRIDAVRQLDATGAHLLDLIAYLFADACERVLRQGVIPDYRETEDALPVVRGRILADRQLLQRHGRLDRIECRFDEQTTDIAENQLLMLAMSRAHRLVRHEEVALRLRRLLGIFQGLCSLDGLDYRDARTGLTYNRLNKHYRDAHELAFALLDQLGVDDLFAGGSRDCFAFLIDMNPLFERFVTLWLGHVLRGRGVRIESQRADGSIIWDADRDAVYVRVRPDVLVTWAGGHGERLPVDAKYKLYDQRRLAPADIYQAFLYAYGYASEEPGVTPRALLVYPASEGQSAPTRLQIRQQRAGRSAVIEAIALRIPAALKSMRGPARTSDTDAAAGSVLRLALGLDSRPAAPERFGPGP